MSGTILHEIYMLNALNTQQIRPYKASLLTILDFGVTSLFILASLNNVVSTSDQTGVYLLALSAWGFFAFMGLNLVRVGKLEKRTFRKEGGPFEKVWLEKLKPFDGQELHPKSRDLLEKFITLATMVEVASKKER